MDKLNQAESKVWQTFWEMKITFTEVLIALNNIEYHRVKGFKK